MARAIREHTGAVFSPSIPPKIAQFLLQCRAVEAEMLTDVQHWLALLSRDMDNTPLSIVAPAFCASRMMGRTFAAYLSASAFTAYTAPLRTTWSTGWGSCFGLVSFMPPRGLVVAAATT
jgi:hypothetical protein